jgi:arabinofuranosyltransferase
LSRRHITAIAIAAVVIAYAVLVWQRRWLADDGLIVVRTARQIVDGSGPVFNVFERAEASTSTLWTWLLAIGGFVTRLDIELVALVLGGVMAITGVAIGADATRRFHRARGSTDILVPAGALIVIAAHPYWDYGTSSLETGLCFFWAASIWWLLVRLTPDASRRAQLVTAFAFGLGPLVRPDFALASGVFLVAAWLILRPPWRRTFALGSVAIALPLVYQFFRMGYYGVLVPLPALAKSASSANWLRGWRYVKDFSRPYWMWLPLLVLAIVLGVVLYRRVLAKRERIVIAAPIVSALLLALYVVRVGGDFMHARLLLVPSLLLALPAFVLPVRKLTAPAIGVLAVWAIAFAIRRGDGKDHTTARLVEDERAGYVKWTKTEHPTDAQTFIDAMRPPSTRVLEAARNGERRFLSEGGIDVAMNPQHPATLVFAVGHLGTGGVVAPLEATVADAFGLANPLGARITPTQPGIPGHEKWLPWSWMFADYADRSVDELGIEGATAEQIRAARHALTCGELAEMLASVREPMTLGRFWDNFTGSIRRTRLVIPSDPIQAEAKFCPR